MRSFMLELCSPPVPQSCPFREPDQFFSQVRTFPCPFLMHCLSCRNMPPMLGRRYRKSVAEEGGRNTGRTWSEDGQRRQAGTFAGLHRLYACNPLRSGAVSHRPEHLGALLRAESWGWLRVYA